MYASLIRQPTLVSLQSEALRQQPSFTALKSLILAHFLADILHFPSKIPFGPQ